MKQLSLPEIKQTELQILKVLKAFCEENGIRYYLSNGTLLGAVKYKGFIPWDDDIDVLVPREDYNRLLACFADTDQYCLFSFERNKSFRYPYAKLCDMSTVKQEENTNNGIELGVDIDIFPLDVWNNDKKRAKNEVKKLKALMFRLDLTKLVKANSANPAKWLAKSLVMLFYKAVGSDYYIKKIMQKATDQRNEKGTYVGCKAWCIYGEREIIPAEVFADTVSVAFEGDTFPAPIGYDTYLRSLYGDYTKDPPLEEQKTHHRYVAYRK